MAYGLKYFSRYRDVDGRIKRVNFYKADYAGPITEWNNDAGAVQYDKGASDSFFPVNPIVSTQAKIGLVFKEQYDLSEFVFDRKTFFCEVIIETTNAVEWSGWVEPWDAAHDYTRPPYRANLTVSCGLAHLSKKKYVSPDTAFKKTGLTIIRECLNIIGSSLNIVVSTHMKENSFPGGAVLGLTSFEINTIRYYDENGEAMHCDEIIIDILNKNNAEIVQANNKWVIRGIADHATGFEVSALEFPSNGAAAFATTLPATYSVNADVSLSLAGGQIRILPPITKYRTEVDLGVQLPYFLNGNMLLWTDAGLVGWDFSHMTKGRPGWERYMISSEGNLSALKINGKAPKPYTKKKKKKFIQVLVPILTGMIGANLKNKYIDLEPKEWIESPVGAVSKGDKSLTISFEYETAPFSSDILIAVRLPGKNLTDGKIITRWLAPGTGNADVSDEFKFIRVPPVNREGLINRGKINVAGNPNYPNGTTVNWAYVVEGVPEGEVRRIGGASGVPVENGDLVVSKIANTGGTQAAVGDKWSVINIRNNPKRGTFETVVKVEWLNRVSPQDVNKEPPLQGVYVRFYKISDEGQPGDWYKIYNLKGALEGFVASDESGRYATTLERGSKTDEEAETIQLITGDYNPYFSGALTKPSSTSNTSSWRRRTALEESMSIYRAMMLDRLCLTTRPLKVFEGDIKIKPGGAELSYLHSLIFADQDNIRMRIVRFSYNDARRIASITAVEVKYEEVPAAELRQDSYIPGSRQLNTIPGQGDGVYPTKEDSTNGRVSAEDTPLSSEQLIEDIQENARLNALFENVEPLSYTVGEESLSAVDLNNFLSQVFIESNEEQDEEDQFDLSTLEITLVETPRWISKVFFDGLVISALAKPTDIGVYKVIIKLYDAESDVELIQEIPVKVYPKTTIKYSLRDLSGTVPKVLGELINGGGYTKPDKWDILVNVTGNHDGWYARLQGMGLDIRPSVDPYSMIQHSAAANYIIGDKIISEVGIYKFTFATYRNDGDDYSYTRTKKDDLTFTLYDKDYTDKAQFFLWGAESNTLIGEIDPDGTSAFTTTEPWDVKMVIEGVMHDAGVSVLGSEIGDLDTANYTQNPATQDAEYFQLGEVRTDFDPSTYNVVLTLSLTGEEVYKRLASFTINKYKVKPSGGLKLGSIPTNSTNFDFIANLPLKGGSFDLPYNWTVLCDAVSDFYDWEGWTLHELRNDALVEQNIASFTGDPQFEEYDTPITQSDILFFGELNSTQIGDIHKTPSTFRAVLTRRLGGASGAVVAKYQSDFSFGPAVDVTNTPTGDPVLGKQRIIARFGMRKTAGPGVDILDVRVDYETIEIFDPFTGGLNHLRVKDKGITYPKIQDVSTMSILGNVTASAATVQEVQLLTSVTLSGASNSNLATALAIKTYIDNKAMSGVSGTIGRVPKYLTANTLGDSLIRESGTTVFAEGALYVGAAANEKVTLAGNPANSYLFFRDSAGTSRYYVDANATRLQFNAGSTEVFRINASTLDTTFAKAITIGGTAAPLNVSSNLKVTNFNADYLDDQHGPYYLDRANHTGTQLAATISDLSSAVKAITLSGLSTGTFTPVTASDNFISAIGKLQGQITNGAGSSSASGTIGRLAKFTSANGVGNSIVSETTNNISVAGQISINRSVAADSQIYQEFTPTDYGIGKPRMYIYRSNTNLYQFVSSDSSGNHGDIDFIATNLTYNSQTIATRAWANTQFSLLGHTHTASQITNFTPAVRASVSAGSGISYDSSTGIISAAGGGGTITGGGTTGNFVKWTGATAIGNAPMFDNGTEINIPSGRSFGVEGPAAVRNYLHVHKYLAVGKVDQHGAIVVHNQESGAPIPSVALEIRSTTHGFLPPRMTIQQMQSIPNPPVGLIVQASSGTTDGLYQYCRGTSGELQWKRFLNTDDL
ncbi:hypothetical protein [Dyadobacter sandarakinus]|uniref:Tip attachment protein J domain-containing protein n=1 Tax=Dyadobacter sandarakinus TaxID=2747268 RepID=A0ABX7I3V1_9BACT|nr:hypothetical protein [Dyadobacter sandarakinus]QRQ99720.1 hypothetical protein HWI92_01710 [Dyadobacter sandarakinus]